MNRFLVKVGTFVFLYRLLFSGYSNTGPFVTNAAPALDATFFNNVENFLDTVNSLATDTHNSSDGNGNATVSSVSFSHGRITRIAKAGPYTVTTTMKGFNHNLGDTPDFVAISMLSGLISVHQVYVDYGSLSSTQVRMQSDISSGIGVYILTLKL